MIALSPLIIPVASTAREEDTTALRLLTRLRQAPRGRPLWPRPQRTGVVTMEHIKKGNVSSVLHRELQEEYDNKNEGSFVLETTYSAPDVRCPKVLVT